MIQRILSFSLTFAVYAARAQEAEPVPSSGTTKPVPVAVGAETEKVIHGALRWLASQQQPNGSWGTGGRYGDHPVAMTGHVLMAYLACGNLPEEGEYARQVRGGMEFLLEQIALDGQFRGVDGGKYMYNHGIATVALAELYGQTRNPSMREKLVRAVQLIVTSQAVDEPHRGGWRYQPRPADADISVTVLQVVALRAAKNAGLHVPQQTIDDAVGYIRRRSVGETGGFAYQAGQRSVGYARTAAAIYSLQVCGHYDDPLVKAGSKFLFDYRGDARHWTYGSYYAAPAQYMVGGDTWSRWYQETERILLQRVKHTAEHSYWENAEVSPVFGTACFTTILAMPWHYIPLYQR